MKKLKIIHWKYWQIYRGADLSSIPVLKVTFQGSKSSVLYQPEEKENIKLFQNKVSFIGSKI